MNIVFWNEVDKPILNNAQKLAKMLANNVGAAKGHKGKSGLTVKDIAHNLH
ncbi:hypothetical protein [Mycoplasma marinum]|uniref:hypothetical protein n=1 Tax=Mycoplasma marinum TaxID=1937190 RepID=UPI00144423A4|nr:hypothetical protein [Mycoplasma marinum]